MAGAPQIDPRALAGAEALLGIALTDEEREQVARGFVLAQRVREQARALGLPNECGPALRFDPRLPGMSLEPDRRPWVRSDGDPGPLPESDDDIAFAPVTRLSRWIERGALSSARLTEICLERLARHGPGLECVATLCEERARAQARRADQELKAGRYRGPLHGIPWGAKDLLDTAGIPTSWGSRIYRERVPKSDAEVVRRLDEAGAVLVAKLSLGELAYGDVWFGGQTRNPWKRSHGSGGSSAGPAAACAAALVPFSIGSETMGSITNPCMTCGTTGLRPTFGRVPRTGAMSLCWSFDKLGPIARTVEDTALVLAAVNGAHEGDPDSLDLPFGFDARETVRGRRIGFVPEHFAMELVSEPERAALAALERLGAELVEVELPDLPVMSTYVLVWVEAAAAFQELLLDGRLGELERHDDDSWPNLFRIAHFVSAVEYVQLQRVRHQWMRRMHELFAGLHVIAAPGMGHTLVFSTNATGHPALTLRSGFRDDGTPVSITLHGRLFDEGTLCAIGHSLERELGVWERRPGLE